MWIFLFSYSTKCSMPSVTLKHIPYPFPLCSLMSLIFFKVDVSSEELVSESPSILDQDELESLSFVQQDSGDWIHTSEIDAPPSPTAKPPPPSSIASPSADLAPLISAIKEIPSQIENALHSVVKELGPALQKDIK